MAEGRGSALKKILAWLIGPPVLAGAILFALANRGALSLSFWPSSYALAGPVYLVVFGCILAGVALGGAAAWLAYGRKRALLRERAREIRRLEGEIEDLKRRLGDGRDDKPAEQAPESETSRRQLVVAQG
ncbi:MAG: lipopolysaccharide assembly protein LapA domain-containing protein [Rhodospirillales bacterium]